MTLLPLVVAAVLPAAAQLSPSPRAITLPEAYALALKRSEVLAESRAATDEALARLEEIRGNVLPHLTFAGQHTFQQNPNTSIPSINNTSIPNYYFQLQQPLFSGFRELLAFKSGKRTAESLRLTARRAESLLYQDVAASFLELERLQRDLEIRGDILKAMADRIEQLRSWVAIGRSRESEILGARSQLAQAQAQLQIVRGAERAGQELLRFLTGEDSEFAPRSGDAPVQVELEPFLSRARSRDDVRAADEAVQAARLDVKVASRQRFGTVGLTGNYYLKRLGFAANTHYDAVFGWSLPLFAGGVITAQVKEAGARVVQREQELSAARRGAERDARTAFATLQWAISSVDALEKAADLAARNLKAQEQDYKLSLITNIQVLDAITDLQNSRLLLQAARQQAALSRARLETAAGGPDRP